MCSSDLKVVTFPLTKKQVEGSIQMQAIQPRVKELQAMYANDPERLQMETARLYKEANFNPLAGCLPTFATLPVFIGLYRALSNAAVEGVLTDGFYWIPSLGGPTSIEARNDGNGFAWLFPFVDGAPPLGWHDTIAYLILPVLLVVSQLASQKVMTPEQPKDVDPSQAQTQAILKFLPFMIGFFSLNVPAGLTLYWFVNNLLSTGQTVYLRKTTKAPEPPPAMAGGMPMPGTAATTAATPVRVEYVPKSQRKAGGNAIPAPKPAPPKVEPMPDTLAAEFGDFDDGPAQIVDAVVVEAKVVADTTGAAAGAAIDHLVRMHPAAIEASKLARALSLERKACGNGGVAYLKQKQSEQFAYVAEARKRPLPPLEAVVAHQAVMSDLRRDAADVARLKARLVAAGATAAASVVKAVRRQLREFEQRALEPDDRAACVHRLGEARVEAGRERDVRVGPRKPFCCGKHVLS